MGPRKTRALQMNVHSSAYLHPYVFDVYWRKRFHDLRQDGQHRLVEYVQRNHFEQVGGLWAAPWQCSASRVDPPFSSYSNNIIESLWRVIDKATEDLPKNVNILVELRELNNVFGTWCLRRLLFQSSVIPLSVSKPNCPPNRPFLRLLHPQFPPAVVPVTSSIPPPPMQPRSSMPTRLPTSWLELRPAPILQNRRLT